MWRNQLEMNLNANIYSLDLPSHNKSDEFPKLSLRLYVNILKNFVDLLSLKKIILAGHSLGGAVIQSYYFTYPSDISALVLIGTGCRLRVLPSILDSVKNDFQMFIADMNEELKKEFLKTTPNVVYNDFKICDEFDTLDKTDSIDIPCLILV
ncbi:MAG: alpha/beta fold hydrolase, partial [Candidatus Heimdallarchaeota archaeon]